MNTAESWTNFVRYNGGTVGARDRFEDFCAELFDLENPGLDVHRIAADPGDDGIDVLVSHSDGIDIYQCKFFRDTLESVQWRQISKSFETAVNKNSNIRSWYLCIPKQITNSDMKKIHEFKYNHRDCGFHIEVIDGNQLISRAQKHGIAEKWFAPFNVNDSSELEDISVKIWRASQEYFKILCSGNNKFGQLKIYENLFPNGTYRDVYYEPFAVNKEGKVAPVQEIFKGHKRENLVLMGEGGIGKTTFLAHQLSVLLKDNEQMPDIIPIYIELNRCPNTIGEWYSSKYGKTNYITRYIKSIMDDGEFESYTPEQLKNIEREFQKEAKRPRYLLLLDGFNEVNIAQASGSKSDQSIREMLRNEIGQLAKFTNVRIVLTTRQMSENYLPYGFSYITLHGLGNKNIRDYLTDSGYSNTDITWIEAHTELLDCLRIPLFLCMFACRNKNERIKPLTRGEILYHFFHRGTPFYSERRNITRSYADNILMKKMLMFTMDFILPTIGYNMNYRGVFQISKTDLLKDITRSFIDEILPVQDPVVPTFMEYESETESLVDLREKLSHISSDKFLDIIVNILGVMNRDGMNGYSFVHHHIRDYFAAYYIIQRIRGAIAIYNYEKTFHVSDLIMVDNDELSVRIRRCLEPVFYEIPDETIQSFIGEILGEHRNIPVLDEDNHWHVSEIVVCEQTVLRQILDMYRYSSVDPNYLISNIVEILKKVRKTVAGEIFDGLDLRNCRFYETVCSIGIGESQITASFRNCKITNQTFMFEGHIGRYIDFVVCSGNSDHILTLGDDEQVCLWNRMTHRMLSSFIVGDATALEGGDPDQKIFGSITQDFLTRFYEYTGEKRRTYIQYVRKDRKELLLSEDYEERVIDDMRFSPFGTYICGVWGGDTVRLFTADDGKMYRKYNYSGEGQICHVLMPQESHLILHVKLNEEKSTKEPYLSSEWAFYSLDISNDNLKLIYRYKTCRKFSTQMNLPVSAFDVYQKKCLIFANHQVIVVDLENGENTILEELSDEIIPESGEFIDTEGSKADVHWDDTIKIYEIKKEGVTTTIHRNPLLEQCIKIHAVDYFVYVIDENSNFHEWNFRDDVVTENVFPSVKLDIKKIHSDSNGHILAEYSNNCILTIDEVSDCLLSTFYEAKSEAKIEESTYLEKSNKIFIVMHGPNYEQILLYDPVSGKRERIEVTFRSQLSYCTVLEENHKLYIAFDTKVVVMDINTGQQEEIWQADAGERFFDFEVKNGNVYLLLQWIITYRMPVYLVYAPDARGVYYQVKSSPVLYITEQEVRDMLLENDIEFFVKDPIKRKNIITARGMFLHPSAELKQKYSSFGFVPEESTRVFYYVRNYDQYVKSLMSVGDCVFVSQNNHTYVTALKEYSEVHVYHKNSNGKYEQKYFFIPYVSEEDSVNLYHAVIGTTENAYCSTSEDKLIKVDPETGKILKQFSWLPGIILTGCDFSGTEIPDNLRNILEEHGARID